MFIVKICKNYVDTWNNMKNSSLTFLTKFVKGQKKHINIIPYTYT